MTTSNAATSQAINCWFCRKNRLDPANGLPVKLQFVTDVRSFDYGATAGSEYRFRETTVDVPRCTRCKDVHERWKRWATKGGLSGLALWPVLWLGACVAALLVKGASFWGALVAGLFLFIPLVLGGMAVGAIAGWMVPRPRSIQSVRSGRQHPSVAAMLEQGWVVSSNQDYYRSNVWD